MPEATENKELHIASLVVWMRGAVRTVEDRISAFAWAELPYASERGRTVVVLEALDQQTLYQRIEVLRQLPGVLDAQLVYHHSGAAP